MKVVLSVLVLATLAAAVSALFKRKYIFVNRLFTFDDALVFCREKYVDLMAIESQKDLIKFQQDTIPIGFYWIGLLKNPNTQGFSHWSDGSPANFTLWKSGEPVSDTSKNCVCAYLNEWCSFSCMVAHPFVCYIWEPELIVVQEMKTWEEALIFCRMKYVDLISLETERDHRFVNEKTSGILTPRFWTGLRFLDGSWFWVNQASMDKQTSPNLNFMPLCPAPPFRCGARSNKSNVLENRVCEEKMNFICYRYSKKSTGD